MNPVRRGAGISKGTMRTAITVATQHNGQILFVSDPSVPIDEQKKELKALKAQKTHPDFALVELWESGAGVTSRVKFGPTLSSAPPAPPADEPAQAHAPEGKKKK